MTEVWKDVGRKWEFKRKCLEKNSNICLQSKYNPNSESHCDSRTIREVVTRSKIYLLLFRNYVAVFILYEHFVKTTGCFGVVTSDWFVVARYKRGFCGNVLGEADDSSPCSSFLFFFFPSFWFPFPPHFLYSCSVIREFRSCQNICNLTFKLIWWDFMKNYKIIRDSTFRVNFLT